MMINETIKKILGEIPLTAEALWYLRQTKEPPIGGYKLKQMESALPRWIAEARENSRKHPDPKRILVFGMLRYWIENTSLLSLALRALGHQVTLAYLPYAHWKREVNKFDLRRQNLYLRGVLKSMAPFVDIVPLLDAAGAGDLPAEITAHLEEAAFRDVQYSLLREDVDKQSRLYSLRLERNTRFAKTIYTWMQNNKPDVFIVPNGSMLEFGIAFRVARYLGIPVMTYEFGEQSERLWLAQNTDVMRQETDVLWENRKDVPLTDEEWEKVKTFFSARQGGGLWKQFSRRWQGIPNQGAEKARESLGLDERPLVLLPTNVLGDSLTLGRQVFSRSMTEWIRKTIEYFLERPQMQLVIRVHPGEQLGWGPSLYDLLMEIFPKLPENIHLLPANAAVNSYDLVNAADFGLVFTTTMGMEMAMSGLPVIVAGATHYRGKGFTYDPNSWDEFFAILNKIASDPQSMKPNQEQVKLAWTYAYRFFFEYPQPYPWHVQHIWQDVERWPMVRVLSEEGQAVFGRTFEYLAGKPIQWER